MPSTRRIQYKSPEKPKHGKITDKAGTATVANVNKQQKTQKQSEVSRKTSKQSPIKGTNSGKVKKQGKTKRVKSGEQLAFAKRCQGIAQDFREEQAELRSMGSQWSEECAEFVENNKVIRMAADQDDSFYEQEMASDDESEGSSSEEERYKSTDSEISMDEQMASGCLAMSQGHSPCATETSSKQGLDWQQEMQYHQAKINAIDEEMKERVLQLHQMMAKVGLLVGNHVDKNTQAKIIRGEYIDFGKLLPKDKILAEEDGRMELVMVIGYWTNILDPCIRVWGD